MELTAKTARKISESSLDILFGVIEKAANEGYTGLKLRESDGKHYEVEARILHTIVSDNKKYLKHLDYKVSTTIFGNVTGISWKDE